MHKHARVIPAGRSGGARLRHQRANINVDGPHFAAVRANQIGHIGNRHRAHRDGTAIGAFGQQRLKQAAHRQADHGRQFRWRAADDCCFERKSLAPEGSPDRRQVTPTDVQS